MCGFDSTAGYSAAARFSTSTQRKDGRTDRRTDRQTEAELTTQGGKQQREAKRRTRTLARGLTAGRIALELAMVIVTATTFQLAETSFPLSRLCEEGTVLDGVYRRAPSHGWATTAYRMPRTLLHTTARTRAWARGYERGVCVYIYICVYIYTPQILYVYMINANV